MPQKFGAIHYNSAQYIEFNDKMRESPFFHDCLSSMYMYNYCKEDKLMQSSCDVPVIIIIVV